MDLLLLGDTGPKQLETKPTNHLYEIARVIRHYIYTTVEMESALSLPRVINFKFPLLHAPSPEVCHITWFEELRFS